MRGGGVTLLLAGSDAGTMGAAMTWWMRTYLLFAALQGLGIGLTGLFSPAEMQIPLRLTPLNDRFAASLYVAGALGMLLVAFRKRQREARLFVIGFGLATALILVLTLLHWDDFMAADLPHRPVWMFDYVVDPVLAVIIIVAARLLPIRDWRPWVLTPLFVIEAVLFGVLGVVMLLAPALAVSAWPWTLPPLAGQLYACFFITFAVGAGLAGGETQPWPRVIFALSTLALCLLVLIVSLVHVDRFKPEPVTWLWFGAYAVGAVAFAAALFESRLDVLPLIGPGARRTV
ncbi:MAG: hypothetical protein JO023_12160 [Chloroflexi bacterium]|nr:hypothetical protein [Chloroflexota bacterium]